jgi:hypothetical protein
VRIAVALLFWGAKPSDGVPPFGHSTQLRVFIDPDLLQYDEVWAAAGTWNDSLGAAPADIVRVAGGVVTDLKRIGHPDVHDVTAWANVDLH